MSVDAVKDFSNSVLQIRAGVLVVDAWRVSEGRQGVHQVAEVKLVLGSVVEPEALFLFFDDEFAVQDVAEVRQEVEIDAGYEGILIKKEIIETVKEQKYHFYHEQIWIEPCAFGSKEQRLIYWATATST